MKSMCLDCNYEWDCDDKGNFGEYCPQCLSENLTLVEEDYDNIHNLE